MKNEASIPTRREAWPDIARGFCALAVILSHIPITPDALVMYVTPFMLPCFFLLSGYFTKNYGGHLSAYLYNRVLKELIVKLLFSVSLTTFSLSAIAGLLLHPSAIPEWIYDTLAVMFLKPRAIFFSILILCSVLFIVIDKICRDKPLPMLLVGMAAAAVGIAVSRSRIIRWWSWDTALVCLLFFLIGYCARQTGIIARFRFRPRHALLSGGLFIASVTGSALLWGVDKTKMIVANNTWGFLPLTLVFVVTGNAFVISLSHCLPASARLTKLLTYIGRHALIYFMFGGPVIAYLAYFIGLLYHAVHWSFLQNGYGMVPVYMLLTVALTLLPCRLSDRFCPALNGSFKLPQNLPQKHPKACIAACAACVMTAAGVFAAAWQGWIIPNRIYARHYPVHGVDVSSYQGVIDWPTLAAQDIDFAYIKATEGSGHVDERFAENWRAVSATDLYVGAYHFFSYDSPGRTQADNFIATVPMTENALPPVVDLEFYGDKAKHPPTKEAVVPELHNLLEALEQHYGKRPILYVTDTTYLLYVYGQLDDYDIWYRDVITDPPEGHWAIWQYTNRMKLDGYDGKETFIDMNAFMGTKEEWERFIRKTS